MGRVWGTWGVVAGVGPLNRQGGGDTASDSSNKSLLHPSCVPGIMLSQAAPTPHLKEPGITMSTPLGRALRLRGDKSHVQGHKASVDMLGLESRFSHSIPPSSPWGPGTGPCGQARTRVGPRHAGHSQLLTLELASSAGSLTFGAGQAESPTSNQTWEPLNSSSCGQLRAQGVANQGSLSKRTPHSLGNYILRGPSHVACTLPVTQSSRSPSTSAPHFERNAPRMGWRYYAPRGSG